MLSKPLLRERRLPHGPCSWHSLSLSLSLFLPNFSSSLLFFDLDPLSFASRRSSLPSSPERGFNSSHFGWSVMSIPVNLCSGN